MPLAPFVATLAVLSCRDAQPPSPSAPVSAGSQVGATPPTALARAIHPVALDAPYASASFAFLRDAIGQRSIVQLGESIHITAEFPRARLPIVRFLHEELGFDVIAFEGSALDAWLAEDLIFRSREQAESPARRVQATAWFALWDTEPMLAIIEYVVASHATATPLYLASFDLQPGNTRPFGGDAAAAIDGLVDAIARYVDRPPTIVEVGAVIAPALDCWKSNPPARARRAAAAAIDRLSRWIGAAAPAVTAKTSQHHAWALERIPAMLQAGIEMCAEVAAAPADRRIRVYQEARDRHNAALAIALRDQVSSVHRVMLWAHHSHVNHNTLATNIPSMGQHLREAAPDALYTIGLFAGSGSAMAVDDGACPPIEPRTLYPIERYGAESLLASASRDDFFIDLRALPATDPTLAAWFAPTTSRLEATGQLPTVLANDFDGAVFVREVHSAELQSMPAAMRMLMALKCSTGGKVN